MIKKKQNYNKIMGKGLTYMDENDKMTIVK